MSPPAPAIAATATAATSEQRRSAGRPSANAHSSIATHAAAKASTATTVCTKSCHVKVEPTGSGQPAVHGTRAATRNQPHDTQSATLGSTARSAIGRARMPRAAHAIADAPATISRRAARNHSAVGMPSAPSSLT
jgi:hypothetical protein